MGLVRGFLVRGDHNAECSDRGAGRRGGLVCGWHGARRCGLGCSGHAPGQVPRRAGAGRAGGQRPHPVWSADERRGLARAGFQRLCERAQGRVRERRGDAGRARARRGQRGRAAQLRLCADHGRPAGGARVCVGGGADDGRGGRPRSAGPRRGDGAGRGSPGARGRLRARRADGGGCAERGACGGVWLPQRLARGRPGRVL